MIPNSGLFKLWLGPMPHVVVTDADHAEAVLSSNELITKGMQYKFLHPWLGTGLLNSSGDKWHKNRKMLTPAFHFQILEQFVPVMSRNGKILANKLEKEAAANSGIVRDLGPFILLCALDVMCETAMGEQINAQSDPNGEYIKAVHRMGHIVMKRTVRPWLFFDFIFNQTSLGAKQRDTLKMLHEFTDSVIRRRKAKIMSAPVPHANCDEETGEKRKDPFMDTLIREHLRDPAKFSELNIREEVDTFMFEGHDTTGWGILWSIYLLGLHPESQQKVQEEVDALFAGRGEKDDLTLDEMRRGLKYTEAVVKEAQRLYPSVPVFSRVAKTETQVAGTSVPAGTSSSSSPL